MGGWTRSECRPSLRPLRAAPGSYLPGARGVVHVHNYQCRCPFLHLSPRAVSRVRYWLLGFRRPGRPSADWCNRRSRPHRLFPSRWPKEEDDTASPSHRHSSRHLIRDRLVDSPALSHPGRGVGNPRRPVCEPDREPDLYSRVDGVAKTRRSLALTRHVHRLWTDGLGSLRPSSGTPAWLLGQICSLSGH